MTDQRLTFLANGREALPVRAIPYVTAWYRFTPDVVAWYLAQDPDRFTEWDKPLTAHHLRNGITAPVLPREWDAVVARLDVLDAETRIQPDAQGYVSWQEHSVQALPACVFVWLDEFVQVYQARLQRVQDEDKRPSDLNLSPLLDDSTRAMVRVGFSSPVEPDKFPPDETEMPAPVTTVTLGMRTKGEPVEKGWVMKKAALLAKHAHQWDTIKSDFHSASENGLSRAAKAPAHGEWFESAALNWADQRGKLKQERQQNPNNSIFNLPGKKHTIEG